MGPKIVSSPILMRTEGINSSLRSNPENQHPPSVVTLEVGMGGLLNATKVITHTDPPHPHLTILSSTLTTVDLVHQAFLGTTLAQIDTSLFRAVEEEFVVRLRGYTYV